MGVLRPARATKGTPVTSLPQGTHGSSGSPIPTFAPRTPRPTRAGPFLALPRLTPPPRHLLASAPLPRSSSPILPSLRFRSNPTQIWGSAMADHSDSDSSPKSSSSSSSSSGGRRLRRTSPPPPPHSDESGSSDGVLVELPSQDPRSPGADPDGGVLVNFDGSTASAAADDAASGETFEDAPEDLAAAAARSSPSLDESMAVIDFSDDSSAAAECRKYKEEREVFGREVAGLRRLLQGMVRQEASVAQQGEDVDERVLASRTQLHSMLDDCSKLALELNSVACAREQEIESLRTSAAEAEVSREVTDAYLGSWREGSELAVARMIASVDAVVGQDDVPSESAGWDRISVAERKTSLLVERYRQVLLGIEQLGQVLAEVKPGFMATGAFDHSAVLGVASEELVNSKRNEADLLQKVNSFGEENKSLSEDVENVKAALDARNAEASKAKAELEQMEHKLLTTKEKLSMAVTKGKSLVQHRDSLKQALAEKTGELERCTLELQQKSEALQAAEARVEELKTLLDEKSSEHDKCLDELRETYNAWEAAKDSIGQLNEANNALTSLQDSLSLKDGILQHIKEIVSEATFPEDLLSLDIIDRLGWLVEQKKIADMIFSEHRKVKDVLGSSDLPHSILTGELDSQISWLVSSLIQANDDAVRMQNEASDMQLRLSSHESKLVSMHEEIDRLTMALLEEKQEKDILVNEHSELMSLHNSAVDKLSAFSLEKNELIKALAEVSEVTLDGNEPVETTKVVERCLNNIQQRTRSSPFEGDDFEKLQTLLYTRDQELTLCRIVLEEDMIDRSERTRLSGELQRMTEEVHILKNDKDSLQKELERVEEKSSLIREKLSMAVKKGKGLVQEREGLKQALDENNSEIEKLKQVLDEKNSEIHKLKQALDENYSEMEKLNDALDETNLEMKKLKQALDEKNSKTEKLKQSLDEKNSETERLKYEIESRDSDIVDFREQVESLSSQVTHFEKLQSDIVALNDQKEKIESTLDKIIVSCRTLGESIPSTALPAGHSLVGPIEKISWILQYIEESLVAKSHVDNELHKVNEQIALQASRLSEALSTIKTLEDELSKSKEYISSSAEEKHQRQLHAAAIEEELEKTNEQLAGSINKLEDANMTINSLQDALSQVRKNLSVLDVEKNEAEAKHEMEISALNAKLAEYVEELDKTHGNLQSHSTEHRAHLAKLNHLVMDKNLLSLMAEEFGKKINRLRDMSLIVKNVDEQLLAKGFQTSPSLEDSEFARLFSLTDYDTFITDKMIRSKTGESNVDDMSFTATVEQLTSQAEFLVGFFKDLSCYMNDDIMLVLRALQLMSDKFAHALEQHESLKLEVQSQEAHEKAQEAELLYLREELRALSLKCVDSTQQIQIIIDDLIDLGSAIELATGNSSIESKLEGAMVELKGEDVGDLAKVADSLPLTVSRLRSQSENLSAVKQVLVTSSDDLKHRLKQAESAAETASQERQLYVERVSVLEKDLETLQDECNEKEIKIRHYQEREDTLKAREVELLSLKHTLSTADRGITDIISKDQMEVLVHKINKINIPSAESELQREVVTFSSPIDKLFFVLDEVDALQQKVDNLTYENENMQLNLKSHAREIEQLKEESRNSDSNHRELESKRNELLEITVGLERMMQRLGYLGGKDISEEYKSMSTQAFLSKLEKLIISSNTEAVHTKSLVQELGTKLQAREKAVDDLSTKLKMLEDSYHAQLVQPETGKERAFEVSSSAIGAEISEIEDLAPMGKASISSVPTAAHARTMRKGSADHLVLNIGTESERLIAAQDSDDKGRIFKSLHTSGMVPAQGKHIADKVDSIWVSGSQILMNRPRARLGVMVYWLFLHLWLLGSIL